MSENSEQEKLSLSEIFLLFLGLGCYCFGGPIAHISFFREKFVEERKWLDEDSFVDLIALCQSLPGPSSSQTCFSLGVLQRGWLGGVASWGGFMLPSAIIMITFALGVSFFDISDNLFLHGLVVAAIAVILNAIVGLSRKILRTKALAIIALLGTVNSISLPLLFPRFNFLTTIIVITTSAVIGLMIKQDNSEPGRVQCNTVSKRTANSAIILFLVCIILGLIFSQFLSESFHGFGGLLSSGALVFGGGHVVLPLLQATLVDTGLINSEQFLTGYGLSNAVPGPMFSLGGYLGAIMSPLNGPFGIAIGGVLGIIALNIPGLAIVIGLLPNWEVFRSNEKVRNILSGINAGVIGLLFSTFLLTVNSGVFVWNESSFDSLFTIHVIIDTAVAAGGFWLLYTQKAKSWFVVLISGLILGFTNTLLF